LPKASAPSAAAAGAVASKAATTAETTAEEGASGPAKAKVERSTAPSLPSLRTPPPGSSPRPSPALAGGLPRTITEPQKVVFAGPTPSETAAILAPPEGWPDITDEIAEVRFSTLQGLDDDVRAAVHALRDKYPGHPEVESLAAELGVELEGTAPAVPPPEAMLPSGPLAIETVEGPRSPDPVSPDRSLDGSSGSQAMPSSSLIERLDLSSPVAAVPRPRLDAAAMLDEASGPLEAEPRPPARPAEQPDFVDRTVMVSSLQPPAPFEGAPPEPLPGALVPDEDEPEDEPEFPGDRRVTLAPGFAHGDVGSTTTLAPLYDDDDDEHGVTLPPGQLVVGQGLAVTPENVATYIGARPRPDDGDDLDPRGSSTVIPTSSESPPPPDPIPAEAAAEPQGGMTVSSRDAESAAASGTFRVSDLGLDGMPDLDSLSSEDTIQQTEEGTVVARAPLPPAPYGQRVPSVPVGPVRLVMLGPRGEAITERRIEADGYLDVGRQPGEPWVDDRRMEPLHARLFPGPGGVVVDDFGQPSGIYTQIADTIALDDGDEIKVGQARLALQRVAGPGRRWGQLTIARHDSPSVETFALDRDEIFIGRDEGDVTLPTDTFVSGDHCRFLHEGNAVYLEDLGSSNGTYIRVRAGQCVAYGGLLLIGHTQFRVLAG
ncbi:MAG: FHA domain-containing protein, partial [Myxococcales bacterium]|nr:FHA domain-containing protein [Myxococcales bacterium]